MTNYAQAHKILLALTDSVASRMRADGAKAFGVSVTTRTLDFQNRSHQHKLDDATDITDEIYDEVKRLLSELWDGRTPLRLLGVALFDVTRDHTEQISLFGEDEQKRRQRALDKTVDELRSRFGSHGIVRAGTMDVSANVAKKHKAQLDDNQKGEDRS